MINSQKFQLSSYSLDELRKLDNEVGAQIRKIEKQALAEARNRVLEIARAAGLAIEDLVPQRTNTRSVKHVYVNPDDESKTWNGLGRKPGWLKEWLDSGITLEELRRQGKADDNAP